MALIGDGTDIAQARHLAAGFLARVQAEHSLPVSQRAVDLTQLVVSELVTNAPKNASGPVSPDLRVLDGLVEVVVWESDPVLPIARAASRPADCPSRIAVSDDPDGAIAGRRPSAERPGGRRSLPHRTYAELVGGPLDIDGWSTEEVDDGAALSTELGRRPGCRTLYDPRPGEPRTPGPGVSCRFYYSGDTP